MTDGYDLHIWLAAWLLVAGFILVRHWRTGHGAGLVFTYVLSFGAIHWLAAAMHVLPWYAIGTVDYTILGLRVATVGMVAFAIGGEIGSAIYNRRAVSEFELDHDTVEEPHIVSPRIVNLYIIGGAVFYGVIFPLVSRLPTASALASTASSLMVLGVALKAWNGWQLGRPSTAWFWLLASAGFPLMTLIGQGFLGFGFAAMLVVAAFVASFYRPRWQVVVAALLVAYMGLSVYVTYMRDRRDIRAVVWGGEAIGTRVDTLADTFSDIEWFDVANIAHLRRVDDRLNQNLLVGAAVDGIETGAVPLAYGGTIVDAVIALIPRVVWPSKPTAAGSGNLVADFTGFTFAEGTSVGIGHVMEWYVNFAMPGVVIGFIVMGLVTVYVDRSAGAWLRRGDIGRFSLWFMPGMSLLQVGGSFVETTSTAAASVVIVMAIRHLTAHWDEIPESIDVDEEPTELTR